MTYHHLNRFKAHATAELTPNERLLAWHFAYETRAKTGLYSQSQRRLQTDLDLDRRTIQKAMARLVDLGLFERIDRTGVYAPIYRLIVACPFSCENLEDHNTKQELETLLATNTPPLRDIQTAPYIKKREEEEGFPEILGSEELGWIIQALENLPSLTEPQKQLKELADQHPKTLAKVALELTAKLDTAKRKKAYLAKVATKDPQNLISQVLDQTAGLEGFRRLQGATEDKGFITEIKPEITYKRVIAFAAEKTGWQPSALVDLYLRQKATYGELTSVDVEKAYLIEQLIITKGLTCYTPNLIGIHKDQNYSNTGFYLTFDKETGTGVFAGDVIHLLDLNKIRFLYTEAELQALYTHINGLNDLRATWNAEHPEDQDSLNKFFMDTNTRAFLQLNPDPVSEQEKSNRFLHYWQGLWNALEDKNYSENSAAETFTNWLELNGSVEEDFEEFLANFPEREKGSNQKHKKKAFQVWLEARKYFENSELIGRAAGYWDRQTNLEFSQLPQNWLADLIRDYAEQKAGF